MPQETIPVGFGLIIIGTEILDGRGEDNHFENTKRLLKERNHLLQYVMILPDDPILIVEKLKWAMARPEPFFAVGGSAQRLMIAHDSVQQRPLDYPWSIMKRA